MLRLLPLRVLPMCFVLFAAAGSAGAQLVVEPDTLYVESRTNEVVLLNRGELTRVDSLRFAAFLRSEPPGVNWYTNFEVWAAPDSFSHTGSTRCYGWGGGCDEYGIPFQLPQGGSATVYLEYDSCPACKQSSGRQTSDSLLIYTGGAEDTVHTVFLDFSRYVSVEEPANVSVPVEMSVYPSPAREQATVRLQAKQPVVVSGTVFDVLGREVLSFPSRRYSAGTHERTLYRRDMPSAGLYFLRYTVEDGNAETRIHVVPLTWQ